VILHCGNDDNRVEFERLGENTMLRKKGFAISEREIFVERARKRMRKMAKA